MWDHLPIGLEERYNKIFSFDAAFLIYEGKLKKTALKLDKV